MLDLQLENVSTTLKSLFPLGHRSSGTATCDRLKARQLRPNHNVVKSIRHFSMCASLWIELAFAL